MKGFLFIDNPQSYFSDVEFVANLSRSDGKSALFEQLKDRLRLPDYFGMNWDALLDCLRDFNWIEEHGIVLVHDDLPTLSEENLKIYLQILFEAIQDWKEGEEHYLKAVFPKKVIKLIHSCIGSVN